MKATVSVLTAFAVIVNHSIGKEVTRKAIVATARLDNPTVSMHYIDKTRRQLTVCGYLTDTGTPGHYIATRPIPSTLTVTQLDKDYNAVLDAGYNDPEFIGNSKTLTLKAQQCREALQNL